MDIDSFFKKAPEENNLNQSQDESQPVEDDKITDFLSKVDLTLVNKVKGAIKRRESEGELNINDKTSSIVSNKFFNEDALKQYIQEYIDVKFKELEKKVQNDIDKILLNKLK